MKIFITHEIFIISKKSQIFKIVKKVSWASVRVKNDKQTKNVKHSESLTIFQIQRLINKRKIKPSKLPLKTPSLRLSNRSLRDVKTHFE